MGDLFDALLQRDGLSIAIVVWFVVRELWPWFRDKYLPGRQAREDVIVATLKELTQTMIESREVMRGVSAQLAALTEMATENTADLAALYAHLKLPRYKEARERSGHKLIKGGQAQLPPVSPSPPEPPSKT